MSLVDTRLGRFASPLRARSLLTVRAAISSASSSGRPRSSRLSRMCSYCRSRLRLHHLGISQRPRANSWMRSLRASSFSSALRASCSSCFLRSCALARSFHASMLIIEDWPTPRPRRQTWAMSHPARPKVLFILGTQRGGTTIVGRMVGTLPHCVYAGEVRKLCEVGLVEGRRCGCGLAYDECPVWSQAVPAALAGHDAAWAQEAQRRAAPPRRSAAHLLALVRRGPAHAAADPYPQLLAR